MIKHKLSTKLKQAYINQSTLPIVSLCTDVLVQMIPVIVLQAFIREVCPEYIVGEAVWVLESITILTLELGCGVTVREDKFRYLLSLDRTKISFYVIKTDQPIYFNRYKI